MGDDGAAASGCPPWASSALNNQLLLRAQPGIECHNTQVQSHARHRLSYNHKGASVMMAIAPICCDARPFAGVVCPNCLLR